MQTNTCARRHQSIHDIPYLVPNAITWGLGSLPTPSIHRQMLFTVHVSKRLMWRNIREALVRASDRRGFHICFWIALPSTLVDNLLLTRSCPKQGWPSGIEKSRDKLRRWSKATRFRRKKKCRLGLLARDPNRSFHLSSDGP